jgi:hypothetical protein
MSSLFSRQRASRSTTSILTVVGIALLVIVLALAVVACGKATIVGKWYLAAEDVNIEFTSDGKVISDEFGGAQPDYVLDGNQIILKVAGMEVASMGYTLDGDTLTIDDPDTGEPGTFVRVK